MFKAIKEFFFGKPVEKVVEIPYKIDPAPVVAPVIEVSVKQEEAPVPVVAAEIPEEKPAKKRQTRKASTKKSKK